MAGTKVATKPYLDKFCGSHFPLSSDRDNKRLTFVPSLEHTGIKTKFDTISLPPVNLTLSVPELSRNVPPPTAPDGNLLPNFKKCAHEYGLSMGGVKAELNNKRYFHTYNHATFMNVVLADMEKAKRDRNRRLAEAFKSKKAELGFEDSFDMSDISQTLTKRKNTKVSSNRKKFVSNPVRPRTVCNQSSLFECLWDTLEIPDHSSSTDFRYGVLERANTAGNGSNDLGKASMVLEPLGSTITLSQKWNTRSVCEMQLGMGIEEIKEFVPDISSRLKTRESFAANRK